MEAKDCLSNDRNTCDASTDITTSMNTAAPNDRAQSKLALTTPWKTHQQSVLGSNQSFEDGCYLFDPKISLAAKGLIAIALSASPSTLYAMREQYPTFRVYYSELIVSGYLGRLTEDSLEINLNPGAHVRGVQ